MADLQEDINAKTLAIGTKGVKFTEDMLKNLVRQGLRMLENPNRTNHGTKDYRTRITIGELTAKSRGAVSTLTIDDAGMFARTMKSWGVQYAMKEMPVLDEKGNEVFVDAKGKSVSVEIGDKGEKSFFDETGKQLRKAEVKPLKEFVVFFDSRNTDVLTNAFKDYQNRCAGKAKRIEKIAERQAEQKEKKQQRKENIKKTIQKYKEKMKTVNKNNPEKHHNRGEQSL